jgi:hypothetical protein
MRHAPQHTACPADLFERVDVSRIRAPLVAALQEESALTSQPDQPLRPLRAGGEFAFARDVLAGG